MAIRLVDDQPDPKVVKKVTCRKCGAKLEYVPIDVKSRVYRDYSGASDTYHWIICPKCSNEIELSGIY